MNFTFPAKLLLFSVLMFLCIPVQAQTWSFEKPSYEKIDKNIQNKNSNLFFDSLMSRFLRSDSTFTLKEKRHLYYGYVFEDEYAPYGRSIYKDSLQEILKNNTYDFLALNNMIRLGDSILKYEPFDLMVINYQLFALEQIGDRRNFEKKIVQLDIVVDALMSSGNGLSKETAFYVIDTSHEYALLGILGFNFGGQQSLIEHYDYLTLAENKEGVKGLYFDVSPCLESLSGVLED